MKISTAVFALSLVGNIALVGVFVGRSKSQASASDARRAVERAGTAASSKSGAQDAAPAADNPLNLPAEEWKKLVSGDLREFTARLRAAGVPSLVLSRILQYEIQQQYGERMKQAMGLADDTPFWQPSGMNVISNDPEKYAAYRALNYEMDDKLKELLGRDDYYTSRMPPDGLESQRRSMGDLPTEKLIALFDIQDQFGRQMNYSAGAQTPEDIQRRAQVQRDERAAIVAALTPAELAEYDIHTAGQGISWAAFNPSEEEFRTIANLQAAFNNRYPTYTPELTRERTSHQQELQDQISSALGPERASDYKLSTASGSQSLARLVARYDLPTHAISDVLAVQKDIQDRAKSVQNDASLDAPERAERLQKLAGEAGDRISSVLGTKGAGAYRETGGSWITNLVPKQPAAAR